jgi:hypothetical protein
VFALIRAQDDGSLLAKRVVVLSEGALAPLAFGARVVEAGGSWLRVRLRGCELKVMVADDTETHVPAVDDPSLGDIRVGDWVLVVARVRGQLRVWACAIGVLPAVAAHQFVMPGEVTATDGTTLTVQDPNDAHTVHTDEQTSIRIPGVDNATIDDIDFADRVLALGQPEPGQALLARLVFVRPPQESGISSGSPEPGGF